MSRTIHLLHVEDDVMQHKVIQFHLTKLDGYLFEVTHAKNEQEALDAFDQQKFDLVILDYYLDETDGRKCIQQFRTQNKTVPILVLSGVMQTQLQEELIGLGANRFLTKENLTKQNFINTVISLLETE
ncbi:MAG: response regulator [Gemmataceae bacterium]